MRNPYLVGTKVYLRPLEEADAAECHVWLNDPDVRRTLAVRGVPHTEASSRAWIRSLDPRRDQVFAIVTREGGVYVGNCGLHDIDPVDRHATLGIVIGRKDQWGQGLGTETVTLLANQLPPHGHTVAGASAATTKNPTNAVPAFTGSGSSYGTNPDIQMSPAMISGGGSSLPHENLQPYLVLNWCIALQGIYPSRN